MVEPVRRRPLIGVALLAVGAIILGVVMAADVGGTPALEALAHALGLAWAPLLLALGLSLALTGLWLVLGGRRKSERPPHR